MTSIASDQDIKVINCFQCNATIKVLSQKVEKKTKCPKCQTIFVPKDYLDKDSAKLENNTNYNKKSIIPNVILVLICFTAIASWFILKNKEIKYDETLLTPSIHLDSKDKKYKSLNEKEVQEVLASYKNAELIPKGFDLPESTIEQARPTRSFLPSCQENADIIISKQSSKPQNLFTQENVVIFNNAYAKTNDPKYLTFLINEFVNMKNCTVDEMISFSEILKTQRESVSKTNLNSYVKTIDNLKTKTIELWDTKDPIQAVNLLILANSMPLVAFKIEVLQKLKPVLELAFKNTNETRKDGLFLLPEESTSFSLKLIKLAWSYHIENKSMPEWLFSLAEKESCRLAYRLEQDGCLPVWQKDEKRISYTEEIYKASIIFDRDDLRYIGYSGWRLSNSYPPKQKKFDFSDLGLFIVKTKWNHNPYSLPQGAYTENKLSTSDSMQITYNKSQNMISVSIGALTQLLFKTSKAYNSINEFDDSIEYSTFLEGKNYSYILKIENNNWELIGASMPYLVSEQGEVKSIEIRWFKNDFKQLNNTFNIQIYKNDENFIRKITFDTRRKE